MFIHRTRAAHSSWYICCYLERPLVESSSQKVHVKVCFDLKFQMAT